MELGEISRKAHEGEQVADLMKHPGMVILRKHLAARINKIRTQWFRASSAEEAEYMRKEARNVEAFFNMAKLIILQGKQARAAANPPSPQEGEQGD